jgi:hypothetical protein
LRLTPLCFVCCIGGLYPQSRMTPPPSSRQPAIHDGRRHQARPKQYDPVRGEGN